VCTCLIFRRLADNQSRSCLVMSDMFRRRLLSCILSEPATAPLGTYPYDILCAKYLRMDRGASSTCLVVVMALSRSDG
jgi:hypothetical protein